MKNQIAGRYLWEVGVKYFGAALSQTVTLWITTELSDMTAAVKATRRFLRRNKHSYPNASVREAKFWGTVDA